MTEVQHLPNPSGDTYTVNGVSRLRKPLQRKGSKRQKSLKVDDPKKLADWHGYDGHRGCIIYVVTRTLSRGTCEQFGLRYPALEPGIYCSLDAIAPDQHHPDTGIAAAAIDGRAAA